VRVVLKDVANHAQVSSATVSNYLNKPDVLSSETRERIAASIAELGYVPSDAARKLRKNEINTVGFIVFEIANPHFGAVADVVERRARQEGWKLLIGNTLGSKSRELEYLELFESQRVGGLIVAPIGDIEDQLAGMRSRGTRSIIIGRRSSRSDQPSVSFDDEQGGHQAVSHLLALGRKNIAFVGGPLEVSQVNDRFQGAVKAIEATPGATLEFISLSDRTVQGGRAAGARILSRGSNLPEAIFAVNDLVAYGVMQSLQAGGVKIPEQVAVIGFDDNELDESASPPLSSIRTPHEEIGEAAFDLVLGKDVRGHSPVSKGEAHVVFNTQLIERASTKS